MTLHLQAFLREGNPISALEEKYAIKATPHPKYPHLILFKYNQIDSPFGEQIVRECRGLILDSNDNWSIVSRPFDKFFNHGEGHAAEIDWKSAKVLEKVDGSLATIYPYDGQWHISTSGSPAAAGNVKDYPFTFEELFWKTFDQIVGKKNLPLLIVGSVFSSS
jgi:RNA ligase